ncbi:MAG: hypothetical protein QM784_07005 [Polyangiaceae bacterium]
MALCQGRNFEEWRAESVAVLQSQRRAIWNYGWAFVVQGQRFVEGIPLVRISPQRLSPHSYIDAEVRILWRERTSLVERQCQAMIRLHVGNNTDWTMVQQSGDRLESSGIPSGGVRLAALSRSREGDRQHIDWIVAPPEEMRNDTSSLELRSITLRLRLFACGDTPPAFGPNRGTSLMIPIPEPGISYMFLDYELVRPSTNRGVIRPILNDDPVSSVDAYPA